MVQIPKANIIFLSILSLSPLSAKIDTEYPKLLQEFSEAMGRNGCWRQGEIEIATSPQDIQRIQKQCCQRLVRKGYSKSSAEKYTQIGVISEDPYWIWVRDAVTFPGGIPGTYDRIVWRTGLTGTPRVAIFPVLPNNKIVVNINFRHATRSWEMELPRGTPLQKESAEEAARRELKEETGCIAKKLILLGNVAPETGLVSGIVPVYFGKVSSRKARHQDESEAIIMNKELTLDEIKCAFNKGYIITPINGIETKVYCRDPFFSFALLQATWKSLL